MQIQYKVIPSLEYPKPLKRIYNTTSSAIKRKPDMKYIVNFKF